MIWTILQTIGSLLSGGSIHSIVTAKTYGLWQSSFSALSNIILLLNLVDLDEDNKKKIVSSVEEFLNDEIIVPIFFSVGWPDFWQSLSELSKLCSSLTFPANFEVVHNIVGGESFFEYAVNVSFNSLRHLIEQFLSKDEETTNRILAIIDATESFRKKVILLRLFYQKITGDAIQQKYKCILSENFAQLPIEAIYDFTFSGWLTPDQNSIKEFLNEILKISRKQVAGVHSYPDPVETKLECVYLLYINDMIIDISVLKELSEERPHLQFLLDSDSFDYSQVDFSNYMWENFARHEKFMNCFIAHKDTIIPKIQSRIKSEEASETEKKIYTVFCLMVMRFGKYKHFIMPTKMYWAISYIASCPVHLMGTILSASLLGCKKSTWPMRSGGLWEDILV